MGLQLREALRSVCVDFGWHYAVFYRAIGSPNPTHLILEDGHWERMLGISGHEAMDLANNKCWAVWNGLSDSSIQLQCKVGDGIIGHAASTGNHQWILHNALNDFGFVSKGFTELNHQLLAGIQTIAVIPVLPHGVVQLGSALMIMENIGLIDHVRNLFAMLGCLTGTLLSDVNQNALIQKSELYDSISPAASLVLPGKQTIRNTTVPLSESLQPMNNPLGLSSSSLTYLEEQLLSMSSVGPQEFANCTETAIDNTKAFHPRSHECVFTNSLKDSNTAVLPGSHELKNVNCLTRFSSLSDVARENIITSCANSSCIGASQMSNQKNHAKSSQGISGNSSLSYSSIYNPLKMKHNEEFKQMKHNEEFKHPYTVDETSSHLRQTTTANDLYDVMDPDYQSITSSSSVDKLVDGASALKLVADSSICATQFDAFPVLDSLNSDISDTAVFSLADADQLLDAVVSKVSCGTIQTSGGVSCKNSLTKINSSSLHAVSTCDDSLTSSEHAKAKSIGLSTVLVKQEPAGWGSLKSARTFDNRTEQHSPSVGAHKSQISIWIESGQSMHGDNLSPGHSKNVDEICNLKRKRPKPDENPRPRPKDRQMIMDRVKELREIVPNGAKCSIDALLEKTIKHMLFLHSVTKHADKLKDIGEPKIINKDGGLLLKDNFEGGATWAFEVGRPSMMCPIIVEDLIPPRQMLVEMLCEQRGFFLEIADIIRGLGLTILKGVMDARKDKVWARFAVEANRDITRMEIFLSLVRLLEPKVGSSTTLQGLDNFSIMQHNMFHSSCIPATGASDRLG